MKSKLLVLAALMVLITPAGFAHAAVDKVVVQGFGTSNNTSNLAVTTRYLDSGSLIDIKNLLVPFAGFTDEQSMIDASNAAIIDYAQNIAGYTNIDSADDIIWAFPDTNQVKSLIATATSTLSTVAFTGSYNDLSNKPASSGSATSSPLSLSIQTSTGAVGTQVSTTKDAYVSIAGQVTTTASIAGNASGDIIVEVAPTNSATAGDWTEWARIGNSQALSLAITLQSVQIVKGQAFVFVPKGWYVKARSVGSGTANYQLNTVKAVTF